MAIGSARERVAQADGEHQQRDQGDAATTVSRTSPKRPRRTDGPEGSRVRTSSTAPAPARTTAAVGRQSGWSRASRRATATRPRMPEPEPDEDLGAGAVLAGAQHHDQAGHDDHQGAVEPEPTASGAVTTSRMPTVAEMAIRISWATRASAATRPGSMSSGSAVMSAVGVELVDGRAGDAEREPREDAADQDHEGEHAAEQDRRVGRRSARPAARRRRARRRRRPPG